MQAIGDIIFDIWGESSQRRSKAMEIIFQNEASRNKIMTGAIFLHLAGPAKAMLLDSEKANRENRPDSRLLGNVLMLRVPISSK